MKKLILLFIISYSFNSFSATKLVPVGKVKLIRGKATILNPASYEVLEAKEGMDVYRDGSVLTYDRSFVKVELFSGAFLNIGANTKFVLDENENRDTSLLHLLKGKIRAQVEPSKNKGPKFLVKTSNAALGVRGTEFLISFNEQNQATSLVTFEGEVAILEHRENVNASKSIEKLKDEIIEAPIGVKEGQFAGINNDVDKLVVEKNVAKEQFEVLRKDEVLVKELPVEKLNSSKIAKEMKVSLASENETFIDVETASTLKGVKEVKLHKDVGVVALLNGKVVTTKGTEVNKKSLKDIFVSFSPVIGFNKLSLTQNENQWGNSSNTKIVTKSDFIPEFRLKFERRKMTKNFGVELHMQKYEYKEIKEGYLNKNNMTLPHLGLWLASNSFEKDDKVDFGIKFFFEQRPMINSSGYNYGYSHHITRKVFSPFVKVNFLKSDGPIGQSIFSLHHLELNKYSNRVNVNSNSRLSTGHALFFENRYLLDRFFKTGIEYQSIDIKSNSSSLEDSGIKVVFEYGMAF